MDVVLVLQFHIILVVGTKLQATSENIAIEITKRHTVVQGMPLLQGSERYFWFGRPQLLLHLIHFALFRGEILGYTGGFSPERELSRLGEKWHFRTVDTVRFSLERESLA
ncbi:hypothetical protein Lal_00008108 [Lupinus albus]|nr:hypothetical protein Lal_00008108 [Lupinus albus]